MLDAIVLDTLNGLTGYLLVGRAAAFGAARKNIKLDVFAVISLKRNLTGLFTVHVRVEIPSLATRSLKT